jgi:hypothetical protein
MTLLKDQELNPQHGGPSVPMPPSIDEEKPLIIAYAKSAAFEKEIDELKDICSILKLKSTDAFKMFAQTNRKQSPIFIIDIGNGVCDKSDVEIAKWTKSKFPNNDRIATGANLQEVSKLQFFNHNACNISKEYGEIAKCLRKRFELKNASTKE